MNDLHWMSLALEEARKAEQLGEVPVGAVIVQSFESQPDVAPLLIAAAGNRKEAAQDPMGHAEVLAIREASSALGRWRLSDCTLYVTLEPCAMCAGAVLHARMGRVVYAAVDPKAGAVESLYTLLSDSRQNHRPEVVSGVLRDEASQMLKDFFRQLRGARN